MSDVSVTDGRVGARAITFSTVRDGLIVEQIEFWPDPYGGPTLETGLDATHVMAMAVSSGERPEIQVVTA